MAHKSHSKGACPKCGKPALLVLKTRRRKGVIIRYLRCFSCGKRLREDEFVLEQSARVVLTT